MRQAEVILREIVGGVVRVVAVAVVLLAVEHGCRSEIAVVREEALLVVVREVEAERELREQIRRRLIARCRAAGVSVRVAVRGHLLDVADRHPRLAVRAQFGRIARIAVRRVARERRPIVAALQRVDVIPSVERSRLEVPLVARLPREVDAERGSAGIVRLNAADFLREPCRREVRRAVRAAVDADLVLLVRAAADERLVHVERARAVLAREVRVQVRRVVLRRAIPTGGESEVPRRRVLEPPFLGEDLNDAVRGVGAVERRRGRAFQHFDALDVVRIQIRRAVFADAAVEVAAALIGESSSSNRPISCRFSRRRRRSRGAGSG